jgi:beta-ureidopropionase / N-carbamoyl-L-amino-acid hydrolase
VQLDEMTRSRTRLDGATAYLELHIEQGPVLDEAQLPASAVDGCLGVRRREIRFGGQAAHAGATPMRLRIDPVAAFAAFAADLRAIAEEHDGLTTIGVVRAEPGTPTAVPAMVRCSIDLRHKDLASLEAMAEAAEGAAARAAGQTGCTFESSEIWSIDPIHFDADLVARAAALVPEGTILTSGPLHDAAAVSLAGVPTVMVFARTLGGLSHTRDEDAREEDLQVAIEAFGSLALELIRA